MFELIVLAIVIVSIVTMWKVFTKADRKSTRLNSSHRT